MKDILSLTGGQPLAGQIRSRRICHCVVAFTQLELFRGIFLSYSSEGVCSSSGCFFLRSLFQILLSCPRQRRWILS
ncbi:hypothetical protein DMB85_013050 [Pectobacterium aquaticum]|uniref:Uncharacterized protein n=1 Tax=Pectobacterium aquaticum TaxID=2204145 RepID=A0A426J2C0_9GAMM|nr:hypothetical protein F164LOC_07910 [Pectobacterium carotovorum]RRN96855.1 hypothetical protein DMB79_010100 [Pectobacterium aquaticum]RRO07396.1 hypothetical protein DMB85_013050 [Pectobacterium aquaticum]RRO07679.1 hypothetical protein DMB81_009830 [Pectobacterium aquaticum]